MEVWGIFNVNFFSMGRKKKREDGTEEIAQHLAVLRGEICMIDENGATTKSNFTFDFLHKVVCYQSKTRGYSLNIVHKNWTAPREMFALDDQLKSLAKFLQLLDEEVGAI